jgi:hypothetical protein
MGGATPTGLRQQRTDVRYPPSLFLMRIATLYPVMPANTAIAMSWTISTKIAQKNAHPAVAECPHLAPMDQPMRSKAVEKMERYTGFENRTVTFMDCFFHFSKPA